MFFMQIHEAQNMAEALMKSHGLSDWRFSFDRARRRFGACRPATKEISLSKHLTLMNDESQVRETILHEIAHALTPGDGHGRRWKKMCLAVGAKPVRCFTTEEVAVPAQKPSRYEMGCRQCGWWADRRRISHARLICRRCSKEVTYRHRASGQEFVMRRSLLGWSLQRIINHVQQLMG